MPDPDDEAARVQEIARELSPTDREHSIADRAQDAQAAEPRGQPAAQIASE